jgi:hypothetical protein
MMVIGRESGWFGRAGEAREGKDGNTVQYGFAPTVIKRDEKDPKSVDRNIPNPAQIVGAYGSSQIGGGIRTLGFWGVTPPSIELLDFKILNEPQPNYEMVEDFTMTNQGNTRMKVSSAYEWSTKETASVTIEAGLTVGVSVMVYRGWGENEVQQKTSLEMSAGIETSTKNTRSQTFAKDIAGYLAANQQRNSTLMIGTVNGSFLDFGKVPSFTHPYTSTLFISLHLHDSSG